MQLYTQDDRQRGVCRGLRTGSFILCGSAMHVFCVYMYECQLQNVWWLMAHHRHRFLTVHVLTKTPGFVVRKDPAQAGGLMQSVADKAWESPGEAFAIAKVLLTPWPSTLPVCNENELAREALLTLTQRG